MGSLDTNRFRSNSCLTWVRMVEMGMDMLYIVWILGACHSVRLE